MSVEQRQLRDRLRARGRALGDDRDIRSGVQEITRLVEAAAYEHWHRLLFTRFLAGNDLLFTDSENGNVAVTLEECEELAPELGAKDGFELACRFSSETLPGVFRRDDPVLEISLAANHTIALMDFPTATPKGPTSQACCAGNGSARAMVCLSRLLPPSWVSVPILI